MELAKAGIFVVAVLLVYPYKECSGAHSSYPIERILRSIQDNLNHQHHHQRSQSNDHHQDDRHQNDRYENEHHQNDRHQNEYQQDDRHDHEYHQNDRHQHEQQQYLRYPRDHQQNDRHQNDRYQSHHYQNDRHSNNNHDLRWSRPQEFEIIHATNDVSPVLVLGKPARELENREVNDPVVLDMEVQPIETQYEIISAKDIDTEQKPQKVFISAADKKPAKGKKPLQRPRASVHENIAVNSLKYSKVSKLNK